MQCGRTSKRLTMIRVVLIKKLYVIKFCNKTGLLSKRGELPRGLQNSRNESESKKCLQSPSYQHVFTAFLLRRACIISLQGKKTQNNKTTKHTKSSPAGTMASSTQDVFPATDKDNLLISFPPSELHLIDSTVLALTSVTVPHLINLEEWGSLLGEEGSGQGFSLPSLPLQMGKVPCRERVRSAWMRRSALALRTETFFSYNYIEELYAF